MGEGGGRREGVVEGERGWVGKGEREGRESNLSLVNVLHLCPMRLVVPLELPEMRLTVDSKCS